MLAPRFETAKRVLDIGAGEGYLARRVKEYIDEHGLTAQLEACDLFPENFRIPGVACRGIDLHGGLPFPDQSIDLAYPVEVLEHLGGHVHPVSVYYISYMAEKAGFGVAGCYIDRVKSSSVVALVLWPLIALASRYARVGMRRRSPVATAENEAHLDRLNSLRVLTGRTIVLDLVRR